MDDHNLFPYEFSIIMAVYNSEQYLSEAVDSIIHQHSFDFNRIQVILVDDGSTDQSGEICDGYSKKYANIVTVHKENGGVASARNAGLDYATGRFLNFMDSDDRFSEDVFSSVLRFFEEHEHETDIVTIPIDFFGSVEGPHWQNCKFEQGERIIDLSREPEATLMFVNASFFSNRVRNLIHFDPHLVVGEDMKVILTILAEKECFGVVCNCRYLYRRRNTGPESLVQSSQKKRGWYFDYFTYLVDWAFTTYRERLGFVPGFVQYEIMCDLQWRFKGQYDYSLVLSPHEIELYKKRLFDSLQYIEAPHIMNQIILDKAEKIFVLQKKNQCLPTEEILENDIKYSIGYTSFHSLLEQPVTLEFLESEEDSIKLDGFVDFFGFQDEKTIRIALRVNGNVIPCECSRMEKRSRLCLDELILYSIHFSKVIPRDQSKMPMRIEIILSCQGIDIPLKDWRFGNFFPLSAYSHSYYCRDGFCYDIQGNCLIISPLKFAEKTIREFMFLCELWRKNDEGTRKAIPVRLLYHFLKPFKRRPLWLISDRPTRAGDNGEAFFRYLSESDCKEIKRVFLLDPLCPDADRIRGYGQIVRSFSYYHKLLHLLCDCNISSSGDETTINPFAFHHDSYRDILSNIPFVFLQHGITKDDVSDWLGKPSSHLSGFVTAAIPEYRSILGGNYGYTEREVWLTGFPRFDYLPDRTASGKQITIMPTWRRYFFDTYDPKTDHREINSRFYTSEFLQYYCDLLNDARLLSAAEEYGYQIVFFPHPRFQEYLHLFRKNDSVIFKRIETQYSEIYAESSLIVTDYSSAVFDFVYLGKPVIYTQPDREEFFQGDHVYTKGYFDYEKDGFGEVEYTLDATVDRIIEYMKNGCVLKEPYRLRAEQFFAFHDRGNSRRVFEQIKNITCAK